MWVSGKEWWQQGNFYSLYIDKFAGDINGLIGKLDYFVDLGIDCLHVLPHYPSPQCDDGFDITDHVGVDPALGTVDDFKRLCSEAHNKNLKIMVDLVANHVSDEHPWFKEACSSKDNTKRDYFIWNDTPIESPNGVGMFPDFKESNWIYNEVTNDYFYATFKPCQPELNWANPAVLEEFKKIIDVLVEQGVDGFRLDAVMYLVEIGKKETIGSLDTHRKIKDIRAYLEKKHPHVILLGEVVGTTEYSLKYFGESDECHLAYNFELMNEMLYAVKCGSKEDRLRAVVEASRKLPPDTSWMAFLRNHDSVTLDTLDEARRAALLKAVDPEGKYMFANGTETVQRLADLLGDNQKIREAFTMLYSLPCATVMYYGDEIGMRNGELSEGEDDMRAVIRRPFDWTLAEQQFAELDSLYNHVKRCIVERKKRLSAG